MNSKPFATPYKYAFFEGNIVPIEQAKVSVMTNALHYGGGIYGGFKIVEASRGLAIFRLDDHISRMQNGVEALGFPFVFEPAKIKKTILELAKRNSVTVPTYVRPIIYRSDLNLSPAIDGVYNMAIYMLKIESYFDQTKGIKVQVSDWIRNNSKSIPPSTKATGGYINSSLAIDAARKSGFDSAIMLDKNGNVSEGAVMNIFLVKDGKLITPSVDSDILEGITRKTILEIAREQGIKVEERTVSKEELLAADEVFFSGTATGITWCNQVDDKTISNEIGPVTSKLISLFENLPETHPELFTDIDTIGI
jgi:branched-chain amino acid aminotransferase